MNRNSEREGKVKRAESGVASKTEKSLANSDFVAHLSHELRTPLNAIIGFSQLLKSQLQDNLDQFESAQMIEQAGKHLWQLIDQLIDLVKIEQLAEINIEKINLVSLLQECCDLMQLEAKDKNISLINLASNQTFFLHCDKLKLRQVILNLISNGIKYNHPCGEVRLLVQQEAQGTQIIIEDSGIGIAEDKIDQLFQPFQRLGAEYTEVEGTGLGLSICKEIMQLMQGEIRCISQFGHGTRFTLHLPNEIKQGNDNNNSKKDDELKAEVDEVITPTALISARVPVGVKLLYIEDNPTNIRFMQLLLTELSHIHFEIACTGTEGIEKAISFQPDIILLDMRLPDMHGLDVLAEIEAEPLVQAKVVALSADALPEQIESAQRAGVDGYLTKPLDLARLHQLLTLAV